MVTQQFVGTTPEILVYNELARRKIDFIPQSYQFGGRTALGGAVVDALIPSLGLAINVQSSYYHYQNPIRLQQDRMLQLEMEAQGITVIYIDEEDARRNVSWYVSEALAGRDWSKMRFV